MLLQAGRNTSLHVRGVGTDESHRHRLCSFLASLGGALLAFRTAESSRSGKHNRPVRTILHNIALL